MEAKRIAIASLIFLIGSSTIVAAAGFGEVPTDNIPETWQTSAMMGGDRGEYRFFGEGGPEDGLPYLRFEIASHDTLYDGAGNPTAGIRVTAMEADWRRDQENDGWENWEYREWGMFFDLDAQDNQLIGLGFNADFMENHNEGVGPFDLITESSSVGLSSMTRMYVDWDLSYGGPCGIIHSLQGAPASTKHITTDSCDTLIPNIRADQETRRQTRHHESLAGNETSWDPWNLQPVGFSKETGHLVAASKHATVWFHESVPYPVQYVLHTDTRDIEIRLVAFEAGETPIRAEPENSEALEWEMTDIQPWGFDETGIDHPFPPSAAYAEAQDVEGIRDYFAAHPSAYLYALEGDSFSTSDGATEWRWDMEYSDGTEAIWFQVAAPIDDAWSASSTIDLPRGIAGQPRPLLPGETSIWWEATEIREGYNDWTPEEMPTELPTLASLFHQYEARLPDAGPPSTWHISSCKQLFCNDEGQPYLVGAGDDSMTMLSSGPAPMLGASSEYDYARVYHHLDGTAIQDSMASYQSSWGLGTTSPIEPASADPELTRSWAPPVGAAWAIAGGVGALLAILYLLAPALKSGVLGMFSRVTPHAALENPTRARIMELIESNPGIHARELVRRADMARGTVMHHVAKLRQLDLIMEVAQGGYTCLFPKGTGRKQMSTAGVVQSKTARTILAEIQKGPTTQTQVAQSLGLNRGTVHHHVKRLSGQNLVRSERQGRDIVLKSAGAA